MKTLLLGFYTQVARDMAWDSSAKVFAATLFVTMRNAPIGEGHSGAGSSTCAFKALGHLPCSVAYAVGAIVISTAEGDDLRLKSGGFELSQRRLQPALPLQGTSRGAT